MDWYVVIKTINGNQYYYKQKTWREGKRVRTHSVYLCPVHRGRPNIGGGWSSGHPNLDGAETLPLPLGEIAPNPSGIDVDGPLRSLVGERSSGWSHAWRASRLKSEGVLVQNDPVIDLALERLGIQWKHSDSGCWYQPKTGVVNIPHPWRFIDAEVQTATQAYYVVVFHEVAHWTKERVGRKDFESPGWRRAYAAEELVAELSALALMKAFGKEVGDEKRHAHYFQHWRDQLDPDEQDDAVEYAKKEAEKAVKYILEHGKVRL